MNRRNFLRILAGSVPAAVVAPTYFFAPVGGWVSDTLVNPNEAGIVAVREKIGNHIFHVSADGVYRDGVLISEPVPPEVWDLRGLAYYQTKPPYISDEYLGISRSPIQKRLNSACELMDDYARRCGAEWTDKPWT